MYLSKDRYRVLLRSCVQFLPLFQALILLSFEPSNSGRNRPIGLAERKKRQIAYMHVLNLSLK